MYVAVPIDPIELDKKGKESLQIMYGVEDFVPLVLYCVASTQKGFDIYDNADGIYAFLNSPELVKAYSESRRRGVRIRVITEITEDNLPFVKEGIQYITELRHMDGIIHAFTVYDDKHYASAKILYKNPHLTQTIYSNIDWFVREQQFLFETLWNKAIPAEQRIKEIEEGVKPEVIETIRDPPETQERVFELLKLAKEEILIIFSTSNAFRRQEKAGGLDLLREMAKSKGLKVRILSPLDDYIKNIIDKIKREDNIKIEIRNIEEPLQTKVSVLIVDRASMLTAELKSDSKQTVVEAIGLSTYSNSNATVLSYASIFESLWNQTELYEQTRQLYQQLKSHDKMKQEFMDIAAHELRTPIQPILGLAQVLKEQISDSAQINFLDVILRNAKRLQRLQQEMLDVTRIESGNLKLAMEKVDLYELVEKVVSDFQRILPADGNVTVSYQQKLSDDFNENNKNVSHVVVLGDPDRIVQVLSNLLRNALKFTSEGTINVRVGRKDNPSYDEAIVSISDSGRGIDPEVKSKLFEKFVSKSEKGTGLGLFISKSIIEAHGGKIWGENNKDAKGSTFFFTLPMAT